MNLDPLASVRAETQRHIESIREAQRQAYQERKNVEQVQIEQRDYLKEISENTKGIKEIIELVRKNNEINESTFQLFQEVSKVMTAQTPQEAEGVIRNVMNKANQANEDFGTIQALVGYGKMLGKMIFPDVDIFN